MLTTNDHALLLKGTGEMDQRTESPQWTFLTNHAYVLLCIANHPDVRLREVAEAVGITERAVQRIVADLEDSEYIVRKRVGRRNTYEVRLNKPLRHPMEMEGNVRDLMGLGVTLRIDEGEEAVKPTAPKKSRTGKRSRHDGDGKA